MNTSAPLLDVRGVRVFYGKVEAVSDVHLSVSSGEMLAILGSNGAGKTTTLRTVAGLERAREGAVLMGGNEITRLPAHRIVELGVCMVPEGRRIFGTLTVDENLRLGGYVQRRHPDDLRHLRTKVFDTFPRLLERRRQLAGTLSGGEQQMLAIGRALMTRPRLLMLDEPCLGLAPMLSRSILRIVRGIADEGVGVVLVEQNAHLALQVADRAIVLETGRVVIEGTAVELAADQRVRRAYLGGFQDIGAAQLPSA